MNTLNYTMNNVTVDISPWPHTQVSTKSLGMRQTSPETKVFVCPACGLVEKEGQNTLTGEIGA